MKTLKQIQEENRKFIIMANNPTAKTYDETLEMELSKIKTCQHSSTLQNNSYEQLYLDDYKNVYYIDYDHSSGDPWSYTEYVGKFEDIIKLTLNKVLISICEIYSKIEHSPLVNIIYIYDCYGEKKIKWDLTKETLEDQNEETQREINKLIKSL